MNEAETRAELIDPLLAAADWGVAQAKDYAIDMATGEEGPVAA
ncbi:MAG: hypothetical protein ACOVNL_07545 [Prochlorococcaceae cyanobacterium]|jgi:hypothetical protein